MHCSSVTLAENQTHYRLRRQTVKPVFGIVKKAMGFRQFLLRGLEKGEGKWALVVHAYICRRLHNLRMASPGKTGTHSTCSPLHQGRPKGPVRALSTTDELRPIRFDANRWQRRSTDAPEKPRAMLLCTLGEPNSDRLLARRLTVLASGNSAS